MAIQQGGTALSAVPRTMHAMALAHGTSTLESVELPTPSPVGSELLVRVIAAGVNPIDAKTRAGRGHATSIGHWPAVLGYEFSGVVVESPFEQFDLQPGDEVFGVSGAPRDPGSFADYLTVPSMSVCRKPSVLSHAEAAGVPVAALTAWGAVVELAKAHEGQRILVLGAAGGVGHFAVQLGAYFGARVVGTASAGRLAWLQEIGAVEAIDYAAGRFEQATEPVDVVIDLIGDDAAHTGPRALDALRPGGLIVNLPTGSWPTLVQDAESAGVRATTYRMRPDATTLAVIARLITSGDLRVQLDEVFTLDDADKAVDRVAAGHVQGKVVLQVADY